MELVQGMRSREEFRLFHKKVKEWDTNIIQVDADISSRAMFYIQEYALSHSMLLADALIAATAVQNSEKLITANDKYYKFIPNVTYGRFTP